MNSHTRNSWSPEPYECCIKETKPSYCPDMEQLDLLQEVLTREADFLLASLHRTLSYPALSQRQVKNEYSDRLITRGWNTKEHNSCSSHHCSSQESLGLSGGRRSVKSLPRRKHTPRTVSRTQGGALPRNQISAIRVAMAFSDAEEDQPSGHSAETSGDSSVSENTNDSTQQDSGNVTHPAPLESALSNVSTASLNSPLPSDPTSSGATASSSVATDVSSPDVPVMPSEARDGGATAESIIGATAASVVSSSSPEEDKTSGTPVGVESDKVVQKLQQIQAYIQQTSSALQALENEGDMSKVSQYNTLQKIMRELKESEAKLKAHLAIANLSSKQKELASGLDSEPLASAAVGDSPCLVPVPADQPLSSSEAAPVAEEPGSGGQAVSEPAQPVEPGSAVIGVIGSTDSARNMQERLARQQEEQAAIATKLKESIARREDLMTRATKERLNVLKQQRHEIMQQERSLLREQGASHSPYADSIPGADTWTIEQLEQAIADFQALYDKVDRLQVAYGNKLAALEPVETEARDDIDNKMQQLYTKKQQVITTLVQLKGILREKQSAPGIGEALIGISERTVAASVSENESVPEESPVPATDPQEELSGAVAAAAAAASELTAASEDLMNKKKQLDDLQKQLAEMKRLMGMRASQSEHHSQDNAAEDEDSTAPVSRRSHSSRAEDGEGALETFLGLQLSEEQRQDPLVASKLRQLSEAKHRLSKMEKVVELLTEARRTGQSVEEALPSEYLNLLQEARKEEEMETSRRTAGQMRHDFGSAETANDLAEVETPMRPPRRTVRTKVRTQGTQDQHSRMMEGDVNMISMNLSKPHSRHMVTTSDSRSGLDRGAIRKSSHHSQNVSYGDADENRQDPRFAQVRVLQHELKEKKNALEALMRQMGKSSSHPRDNISENISEGGSVASDQEDIASATWGASQAQRTPNLQFESDEEDLVDEELPLSFSKSARRSDKQNYLLTKDRNRFRPSAEGQAQVLNEGSRYVNDLGASTKGARPKVNRSRGGSIPRTYWETSNMAAQWDSSAGCWKQSSNHAHQMQNSVTCALAQLSQVQDTINSLYEGLQRESFQSGSSNPLNQRQMTQFNPFDNQAIVQPRSLYGSVPSSVSGFVGAPWAGGGFPTGAPQPEAAMNQQLMSGLHQCFSQLYLHTLEIQALSKHLQVRPPSGYFFPSVFPPGPF